MLFIHEYTCRDRDSNLQSFKRCLLEFDRCSNPLSHHGWIVNLKICFFVKRPSKMVTIWILGVVSNRIDTSNVFFIDDPTEPDLTLQPPSFLVSVEYNVKDPNILAGGCYNGQVWLKLRLQLKFKLRPELEYQKLWSKIVNWLLGLYLIIRTLLL